MIYIENNSNNPYFNLALEEYIMKNFTDNCFMLWINSPTVVCGRNQNTIEEVNVDYANKNNINIVRRMSGGGAVFHDLGNLNFTFIVNSEDYEVNDFQFFSKPIIDTLDKIGIKSEFSGRNDITINNMKFSGNSQYRIGNRILHHGTLLFKADLGKASNVLNVKDIKFQSKSVKSVKSRITNIYDHLKDKITIEEFREILSDNVMKNKNNNSQVYNLTDEDIKSVEKLIEEKYSKWEWNFGVSPEYNFKKSIKTKGGIIEINLDVSDGYIEEAKIFGDFFGNKNINDIESLIIGKRHTKEDILSVLENIKLDEYMHNVSLKELMDVVL